MSGYSLFMHIQDFVRLCLLHGMWVPNTPPCPYILLCYVMLFHLSKSNNYLCRSGGRRRRQVGQVQYWQRATRPYRRWCSDSVDIAALFARQCMQKCSRTSLNTKKKSQHDFRILAGTKFPPCAEVIVTRSGGSKLKLLTNNNVTER